MNEIILRGCSPEPLMSYLKALGILRIIGEQKDPTVRGCWRDGFFVIRSVLDEGPLLDFFINDYMPTPVFAPWNGDGGFLTDSGTSRELINQLRSTEIHNLKTLKNAVKNIDDVSILKDFKVQRERKKHLEKKKGKLNLTNEESEELSQATRRVNEIKNTILYSIRSNFPDEVVQWLDSCVSITSEGFSPSPLLGSGGCDGRLEMSANFISNILKVFGCEPILRKRWAEHSILAKDIIRLENTAIGQFSPGHAGGPNATQGFEGGSGINPYDFIFMIEGSIFINGAVSRRYGMAKSPRASFPFPVYSSPVGYGSCSDPDAKGSRGELWLPLWDRMASLKEIRHLFSEGRAEISGKQAANGVDFARAVASLGIDRGVVGFSRYSFLLRNGRAYLATPIGKFDVVSRPTVDLLRELDPWLERFRASVSDDKTPPRFRSALRRVESSIFGYCQYGGAPRFADILCALGKAERELAVGEASRENKPLRPLAGLSAEWLSAADDGSVEFEVALSLASIYDASRKIGPLRSNLEPVETRMDKQGKAFALWTQRGRYVVWNSYDLVQNMVAILDRRIMDGEREGCEALPLEGSRTASLDAVAAFIAGETDDERITELLWGMILIDQKGKDLWRTKRSIDTVPLPRVYALLKLLFLPRPLPTTLGDVIIRPEPAIVALLRAKRLGDACDIALRRLRASGLVPICSQRGFNNKNVKCWHVHDTTRLAAALLIPVSRADIDSLKRLVLRGTTAFSV